MKVMITGASGFVGRTLTKRLAAAGHQVVAVTRTPDATLTGAENVPLGNIGEARDWGVMDGCDAVVHLAAYVHRLRTDRNDQRRYREVNVDATARLVEEAERRSVGRFVFTSSVKVHGESSGEGAISEASPIAPADDYSRTKAEAEIVVRRGRVPSVILRPPLVYGPGVGANFMTLMWAVAKNRPLPLGMVRNARSFIYVENLVSAIESCLTTEVPSGSTFLLSDGSAVSSPELVRCLAAVLGVRARLVPVPVPMLRLVGSVIGRRSAIDRLVGSLRIDDSRIRRELGWNPPFTLDEGLERTVAWFRSEVVR